MKVELFCVCSEEWCFCTKRVEAEVEEGDLTPEIPCPDCSEGKHVGTRIE